MNYSSHLPQTYLHLSPPSSKSLSVHEFNLPIIPQALAHQKPPHPRGIITLACVSPHHTDIADSPGEVCHGSETARACSCPLRLLAPIISPASHGHLLTSAPCLCWPAPMDSTNSVLCKAIVLERKCFCYEAHCVLTRGGPSTNHHLTF